MKSFFDKFGNLKGAKFLGIKGYENKNGEVANLTILVNFSVEKAKANDLEKLKALTVVELSKLAEDNNLNKDVMLKAHEELIASGEKNLSEDVKDRNVNSQAQTDAYLHLTKGLKMHKETMDVFIYGLVNTKTILVHGEYPARNKREKTVCREVITKHCKLRMNKYRQYNVGNLEQLKIDGTTFVRTIV